ncbi:MAG TPA: hypothetical protein VJ783_05490 [Pirellulales bacterium]|nr:hypothetical protein [Pirellulales bacterium]
MKSFRRWAALAAALTLTAIGWPGAAKAQWTNPLLTEGVGSGRDLSDYYYHSGRAAGGYGPAASPRDKNPAETLLREMNGTHYRRHTGRAYFRGRPLEDARQVIARQMARDQRRARHGIAGPRQANRTRSPSDTVRRPSRPPQPPRPLPPPSGPLY